MPADGATEEEAMRDWAELLVARARADAVELIGDGGRWPRIRAMSAMLLRCFSNPDTSGSRPLWNMS